MKDTRKDKKKSKRKYRKKQKEKYTINRAKGKRRIQRNAKGKQNQYIQKRNKNKKANKGENSKNNF